MANRAGCLIMPLSLCGRLPRRIKIHAPSPTRRVGLAVRLFTCLMFVCNQHHRRPVAVRTNISLGLLTDSVRVVGNPELIELADFRSEVTSVLPVNRPQSGDRASICWLLLVGPATRLIGASPWSKPMRLSKRQKNSRRRPSNPPCARRFGTVYPSENFTRV